MRNQDSGDQKAKKGKKNMIWGKVNFNNGYWPHFFLFYESYWIDDRSLKRLQAYENTEQKDKKKANGEKHTKAPSRPKQKILSQFSVKLHQFMWMFFLVLWDFRDCKKLQSTMAMEKALRCVLAQRQITVKWLMLALVEPIVVVNRESLNIFKNLLTIAESFVTTEPSSSCQGNRKCFPIAFEMWNRL